MVPILQGYEDAGDFTVKERLKTSIHVNLVFYLIVGAVAFCGLILLFLLHGNWLVSTFLVQLLVTSVYASADDLCLLRSNLACLFFSPSS